MILEEGDEVKFDKWSKTQRLSFTIYADFEAFLLKICKRLGISTEAFHFYHPISYGFINKASDDVPLELREKFDIPQTSIIFHDSEGTNEAAKAFLLAIMDITEKIRSLLKTNIDIVMTDEEKRIHEDKNICDLCR